MLCRWCFIVSKVWPRPPTTECARESCRTCCASSRCSMPQPWHVRLPLSECQPPMRATATSAAPRSARTRAVHRARFHSDVGRFPCHCSVAATRANDPFACDRRCSQAFVAGLVRQEGDGEWPRRTIQQSAIWSACSCAPCCGITSDFNGRRRRSTENKSQTLNASTSDSNRSNTCPHRTI